MKTFKTLNCIMICLAIVALGLLTPSNFAKPPSPPQNGTTLAAYKTLDICELEPANGSTPATWRYSGEIAVWNEGAVPTQGLAITDMIQYKVSGSTWSDSGCEVTITAPEGFTWVIPAGTTMETATIFTYVCEGPALPGSIRNVATVTITNHSGSLGTPKGPETKVTWSGEVLPCAEPLGCTYTQGYWGNKPDVEWPYPFERDATFFLSGKTWQEVLDTPVNVSQGYYQLAHQYIAAVLNRANGAFIPQGVKDTLVLANTWLLWNNPSACTGPGSCGLQKDWAAVLDQYNSGLYPDGPPHCE
jgi:hypothetical protein